MSLNLLYHYPNNTGEKMMGDAERWMAKQFPELPAGGDERINQ